MAACIHIKTNKAIKSVPIITKGNRRLLSLPDEKTGRFLKNTAATVIDTIEKTYTGPIPKIGKCSCFLYKGLFLPSICCTINIKLKHHQTFNFLLILKLCS